jgi:hypothetical protein
VHFCIPPSVGPADWLGVDLDKVLGWPTIASVCQRPLKVIGLEVHASGMARKISILCTFLDKD